MSDLMAQNSGYQTGAIDTATTQVDDDPNPLKGEANAQKINGLSSAIIQVETILGVGPTLKGTKNDLGDRLSVAIEANGKIKDFTANSKTTFPLSFSEGGTGATGYTDQQVIYVNGASFASSYGLLYHGPSSVGSGSLYPQEGIITIATNQQLFGLHLYTSFTLNSGVVLTVPAGKRRVILIATSSITINGTINASAAGGVGGSDAFDGGVSPGGNGVGGTDQSGGNSGHGASGGVALWHGLPALDSVGVIFSPWSAFGGGGGAGGSSGIGGAVGGAGGGSIVLIAPTVTLNNPATLNTSGVNGGSGSPQGDGGGGGGAGNIYIITRTYTNNGATFTQVGGAGGLGANGGANAAAGGNGIKQILIYR